MLKDTYGTKEAAELTGASRQSIRAYTPLYERYLSTDATPEKGKARKFTPADLKLIAFVRQCTAIDSLTHDETQQRLADGELDNFEWEVPEEDESAPSAPEEPSEPSAAIELMSRLQTAEARYYDVERREQAANAKVDELQQRIEELQHELGEAQGELEARKRRRPAWLKALIGE